MEAMKYTKDGVTKTVHYDWQCEALEADGWKNEGAEKKPRKPSKKTTKKKD